MLPDIARIQALQFGLRLVPKSAAANEFIIAWLKTLAGEQIFRDTLVPVIRDSARTFGLSPMHAPVKRALAAGKQYITSKQLSVMLSDRDTYLCALAMGNDAGLWPVEALAKALKLKKSIVVKAMKTLAAIKFVKKTKNGSFLCPLAAGGMVEYPHLETISRELLLKLEKYNKELVASGFQEWERGGIIRVDSAAFHGFFPVMGLNLETAQTYTINEKTNKSALYYVEGRIVKLRDF
ncbi:MAG: hypothetical protein NTY45_08295 [Elusimicrobia bacterium]|nr:hypothetical protein [Elusimicrobiota bacterium]